MLEPARPLSPVPTPSKLGGTEQEHHALDSNSQCSTNELPCIEHSPMVTTWTPWLSGVDAP
ncbi:hypothetical protein Hesp01_75680 [Herbidospora sp. NBRC 101105]|nr:hypothetical protein Hesp01_75680 [Herbidospora sp. NBRC 101105]